MSAIPVLLMKPDSEYYNFISGRRVIFVGPGSILKGRGLGSWIDSFDVVIRTNHFPVLMHENPCLSHDYGSKCSVIYINMHYYRNNRPIKYKFYEELGAQWLCSKKLKPVDLRIIGKRTKVRDIRRVSHYIHGLLGDALMGSVILHDVISHCPGEFFITGIDFFASADKQYSSYAAENYISEKGKLENSQRDIGQGKGHDLRANARYMLSMHEQGYFKTHEFVLEKIEKAAK